YAAEREMESAWRSGHPERTPLNYGEGGAFKSSVNVLKWYWGIDVPKEPYVSKPLADLTKELRLYASAQNDYTFYRYTNSRVMADDFMPWGSYETYEYLMGGKRGARWDAHLKLAVAWPSGGGPDVARLVMKADDSSLEAVCYSFDSVKRDLEMRLCRIQDGRYRVSILKDSGGQGKGGETLWSAEADLRRFDIVTVPVPPKTSVVIKVEQLRASPRPAEMADLAIDSWDAYMKGSTVTALVHNLGNAPAKNVVVRLMDGSRMVQEKTIERIDAPVDYQKKRTTVTFENVTPSRGLHVVLDPADSIREIIEANNTAQVRK
ncbi:MAG: CARDB domain-containing protein, partial [Candidatus Latescibacterota bacterium]